MECQVDKSAVGYDYVILSSPSFITLSSSMQTTTPFISLRCKPTLATLPPELLSRIGFNLSLCEYSCLSRTCSRLHRYLFHPAELVHFLKARYRLSIESGSIIIFAYLANMQLRAPLLLERIFEDFFADSPLRLQEEDQWKRQRQQQRKLLNHNTFQLNQAIMRCSESRIGENNSGVDIQCMDSIQAHQSAEKTRRQAKWDAVRMLGVLYALDKTHVGPSSSVNALALSGASDIVDQPPVITISSNPTPDPVPQPFTPTTTAIPSLPTSLSRSTLEKDDHAVTILNTGERGQLQLAHQGAAESSSSMSADHCLHGLQSRRSLSQGGQDFASAFCCHVARKPPLNRYSSERGSRDVLAPSSQEYSWHSFSSREDYTVSSPVTFFNRAAVSSQASGTTTQAPSTSQTNKLKSFARRVSRRRRLNQRHGEKPVRDRALSAGQLAMYQHQHKSWYDEDIEMRKGSVESFSDEEDVRLLLDDADYTREPSTRRTAPQVESNSSINGASDAARTHTMNMSSTVFSLAAKSTPAREREPLPMPNRIDDSMNRHQQQQQHILNRNDKIAFLTKYTDRMHLRLQALGIKDWGKDDIRRKKTYQLMIQHNDKTGEKDLVEFYLDRYGGSAQPSAEEQQQPQQSTEIGTAPGVLTSAAT
ncbi:hypothetical protein EDD21DRAFT_179037 [Dissophora ornata]|nr:hypothetical protein EDD21DRAFT_179037 [Dissophora ornata]